MLMSNMGDIKALMESNTLTENQIRLLRDFGYGAPPTISGADEFKHHRYINHVLNVIIPHEYKKIRLGFEIITGVASDKSYRFKDAFTSEIDAMQLKPELKNKVTEIYGMFEKIKDTEWKLHEDAYLINLYDGVLLEKPVVEIDKATMCDLKLSFINHTKQYNDQYKMLMQAMYDFYNSLSIRKVLSACHDYYYGGLFLKDLTKDKAYFKQCLDYPAFEDDEFEIMRTYVITGRVIPYDSVPSELADTSATHFEESEDFAEWLESFTEPDENYEHNVEECYGY